MKEIWMDLDWPKRGILVLHAALAVLFIILYSTFGRQKVIRYEDKYLRYTQEDDASVYTGRVKGRKTKIRVSDDCEITFTIGDTTYGPYTIVFDDTAIPAEESLPWNMSSSDHLKGIEVFHDKTSIFRGAYQDFGNVIWLVDDKGNYETGLFMIEVDYGNDAVRDLPEPPTIYTIVKLALKPDIESRGEIQMLVMGLFLSITCVLTLVFADELFRHNLKFMIRNAEDAEPSEWELASRWIGWIVLTILAVISYVIGLMAID